jgi:signal transduction histidine kinase
MHHIDRHLAAPRAARDLADDLRWLLRLRWLVVPIFVAVELASGLLLRQLSPWAPLALGAALLAANGVYALVLSRDRSPRTLLAFARFESLLVVAVPVAIALLHRDPASPLRYGVLLGVVGAAAVLPRAAEVAAVALWAVCALVAGDALALELDAARITHREVARWALEGGVVATVAIVAGYLHHQRVEALGRARLLAALAERARLEWEATLDSLDEGVVLTDADGVVTRANRAFAKLLSARPHELVGRPLSALLAGHPERWWTDDSGALVEIEDPIFDALYELAVTRVGDRFVRVVRDVGEQRRLHARLVQADKLASVGLLASGVAHELNNPAAFVTSNLSELRSYCRACDQAFADLLALALEAGAADRASEVLQRPEVALARREAPRAVDESLAGMERIRQMIANLRSVARRDQAGEPLQPVSLAEVVEVVTRTAGPDLRAADARVEVRDAAWVMGHRGELVDVALNLVVNAVQAREEGRPNRVVVELAREGNAAVLRVSDTGKGIPTGHLKRLFEPFFTTKAAGEGTGLGLALARDIVLAHGGSIDVQTEVGVGTTFVVRLPAIDPDSADARPPSLAERVATALRRG